MRVWPGALAVVPSTVRRPRSPRTGRKPGDAPRRRSDGASPPRGGRRARFGRRVRSRCTGNASFIYGRILTTWSGAPSLRLCDVYRSCLRRPRRRGCPSRRRLPSSRTPSSSAPTLPLIDQADLLRRAGSSPWGSGRPPRRRWAFADRAISAYELARPPPGTGRGSPHARRNPSSFWVASTRPLRLRGQGCSRWPPRCSSNPACGGRCWVCKHGTPWLFSGERSAALAYN